MLANVALIAIASTALAAARAPSAEARSFTVPLSAAAQASSLQAIGLAGDSDASGLVKLTVDPESRRICYDFTVTHLSTPLMAHIHKGATQDVGPSVVTLFTGPGGELNDCLTWTEKWLAEIVANPRHFYVNLYTTECPEGALRGQLHG